MVVAFTGVAVLGGWIFGVERLMSVGDGLATMKPNIALGFLLAGAALSVLAPPGSSRRARGLAQACALTVVLGGVLTLVEYATGWASGIDELLFADTQRGLGTTFPGRMGVNTALGFVLLGVALLGLDVETRRGQRPAQLLALAGGALAVVALVGYLYSVTVLYGIASYTQMALHTAGAFVLLSAGILVARPDRGVMATVTSAGPGSVMVRRFLPAALGVPVAVGWLRLEGQRAGLYGTEVGLALMVTGTMAVFSLVAWFNATRLNRADAARRDSEARNAATLEAALDAIVTIDHRGSITEFNAAAERTFGYRRDDVLGREMAALLIPPALRDQHRDGLARYAATGHGPVIGQRLEMTATRADGTEFPVELTITRLPSDGPPMFTGFLRDITDQKRAQEALRESEASFRLLFSSNPHPMWVYDVATLQFLEVNDAAVAQYGYSRDEFLRMRISDIRPPEDVPRLQEFVASIAAAPDQGLRKHAGRWRHRLKDGRIRDVDIVSHSLDFAGRRAALVVAVDVTEVKEYAERLSILHEIDRAIIAGRPPVEIAEAVLRRLRPLLGVPRAIVNLFDLASGEVEWLAAAGRRRVHLGPGVRFPLALMGDVEALRRGELQVIDVASLPRSADTEALRASGVHVYMVVPMIAGGELIGALSFGGATGDFPPEQVSIAQEAAAQFAIAISQARLYERVTRQAAELEQRVEERTRELSAVNERLEQEIAERRRAEAEADRANLAKSEFLSRMSHELRTPLNSIIGFAQLLELEAHDGDQGESVDQILKGGRHLLGLINEVLDIARIEAGMLAISLEPVGVAEVLHAAVDLIRPQAAARGIDVLAASVPDEYHATADRQRLQQVLLNLLSNAVKYNREGGAVRVACEDGPAGRLRFTVSDTGSGIAPALMDRLFKPFERLGAEQTPIEGTGLGLALSQRLVEAMGGTLTAQSTVGEGTTFTVELERADSPPVRDETALAGEARDGARADVRGTVLYIEDNLSNLRLIERIIARRPGVTLLSAMQGRRGLELAQDHHPNLIILDLHLPDLPGTEVLTRLLGNPKTKVIPVVILSADATPGRVSKLLEQGARSYLTKPLDVKQLLAVIDDTLGHVRYQT